MSLPPFIARLYEGLDEESQGAVGTWRTQTPTLSVFGGQRFGAGGSGEIARRAAEATDFRSLSVMKAEQLPLFGPVKWNL
jgi:hypothetical protein